MKKKKNHLPVSHSIGARRLESTSEWAFTSNSCFSGLNSAHGWPGADRLTPLLSQEQ